MFPQHALSDGPSTFTLPVVNSVGLVVLDGFSNFSRNLKILSDTLMPNTRNLFNQPTAPTSTRKRTNKRDGKMNGLQEV